MPPRPLPQPGRRPAHQTTPAGSEREHSITAAPLVLLLHRAQVALEARMHGAQPLPVQGQQLVQHLGMRGSGHIVLRVLHPQVLQQGLRVSQGRGGQAGAGLQQSRLDRDAPRPWAPTRAHGRRCTQTPPCKVETPHRHCCLLVWHGCQSLAVTVSSSPRGTTSRRAPTSIMRSYRSTCASCSRDSAPASACSSSSLAARMRCSHSAFNLRLLTAVARASRAACSRMAAPAAARRAASPSAAASASICSRALRAFALSFACRCRAPCGQERMT